MDTKCPYCGEEMVLGYIRSRDGVVWAKDPSGISSIPWLASGPMVSLAPGTSPEIPVRRATTARSARKLFWTIPIEIFEPPLPLRRKLCETHI